MKKSSSRPSRHKLLLALGTLALSALSLTPLPADVLPAGQPLASEAAALPVTAKFEKTDTAEGPPYVLKLTNTSKQTLNVSATVLLSVMSHNRDKSREVPAHPIEAGQTWIITELAALDRVILKAEGFAPLELVVK